MKDVVIDNPVINSPFVEPNRHFRFSEEGITNEVVNERRKSSYFVPIAKPKKRGRQLVLLTEWTEDRIEENRFINDVRRAVEKWRKGGHGGITKTTSRLLEYWTKQDREKKLFFCQIEALETAIYITEVAKKAGDNWIDNDLRHFNKDANPELFRIALKMATGTGKTVVMAMLIAWQTLNKISSPQDTRFSDTFLIATPGITIRDRLRVLLPNDPQNYYRQRDILPTDLMQELGKAKILITNFHAFKYRETIQAGKLTKNILKKENGGLFTETPDQMVRRVCRELGNKKNIIVINDEAHHCYRRRQVDEEEIVKGDERKEIVKREEEARVWISGLEAIKAKIGVKAVYDLSATPFFLKGSGYSEGTLFPWVVSDFSLIDAIESGIVKVPRVPVADNSMTGDMPTYRDLWYKIREDLPKKGRKASEVSGEPKLPAELEGALQSLYSNYEKYYQRWQQNTEAQAKGLTPPVFIVVCNNCNVSKLVYDYVSGWEKPLKDASTVLVPGKFSIFNNVKDTQWTARPNTILIDSEQLESGEAMSADFKSIAKHEIDEFKADYCQRFPGRDAEKLTDEDLLREVMNTVGKQGKLGEQVKCVVSVSMLTEGWDANTVTHILGVRAFGTQLLCEQVVGRGLRRMSYSVNDQGSFEPEYAEVYGVPFSFIPCSGSTSDPKPGPMPTRVRALPERITHEITFPRLTGYRYELPAETLKAKFTDDSKMSLSTTDIPTKVENAPIIGQSSILTLDDLKKHRKQEVAFLLSKLVLEKYFQNKDGDAKPWLFPQILRISKEWIDKSLYCADNTFPQLLLLIEFAYDASVKIYHSIVAGDLGDKRLMPILRLYDTVGTTQYVDFDTTRPVYPTSPDKCHISHVVADTGTWEQKMAQVLENMDEVVSYVKNHGLNFTIPYLLNGDEKNYVPDFIVHIKNGDGAIVNLIVEVTGEKKKEKAVKVATARNCWIPAVNNHGGYGRWGFIEITDPWDAMNTIRKALTQGVLFEEMKEGI